MRGAAKFNHRGGQKPRVAHNHESRNSVQTRGRAAYLGNVPMSDNPYATDTSEARWWEQGWLLEYSDRMCA